MVNSIFELFYPQGYCLILFITSVDENRCTETIVLLVKIF